MTDHKDSAPPSDPSRQDASWPQLEPFQQPDATYAAPQHAAPPTGTYPAPYGPQNNANPGQYAAPQYVPGYAPQYPPQAYGPQYPPVYGQPAGRSANPAHALIAWVFAVLTLAYMLPWAIAATRGKSNAGAIAVLNFFVGWTVIGWIAALVMACSAEQAPSVVIAYPQQPPYYPPAGY